MESWTDSHKWIEQWLDFASQSLAMTALGGFYAICVVCLRIVIASHCASSGVAINSVELKRRIIGIADGFTSGLPRSWLAPLARNDGVGWLPRGYAKACNNRF